MAISSQEKRKFKNQLRLIKSQEEFKNFVYDLYINHKYSYRNIVTISRNISNKIDIPMVIKILEEFDVKRCSKGDDCKSPNGCIQSRENFSEYNPTADRKSSKCVYCQRFNNNFKNADQTKQNHMLEFQKIKELDKQDEFLVELYKKGYTYQDLSSISLKNIKEIISLLEKYDIKKCYKGDNCKNPNGCIQSRERFAIDNSSNDKKQDLCIYCRRFDDNFKNADQNKQNHMLEFQEIKGSDKQDEFLVNLYKQGVTARDLTAISLKGFNNVINLLEKYDIKRCSTGENCKSPNGYIQSRSNFIQNNYYLDKKDPTCVYCQRFNDNFRYANQTKQNHILEFQKIKELDKQDEFLVEIYKKEEYTYQDLATISIRSIEDIISLLEKYDIKKCSECNTVQNRNNFTEDISVIDNLSAHCKICQYKYNLENKEKIDKRGKMYYCQSGNYDTYAPQLKPYDEEIRRDPNNLELIQVRCKYNGCNNWFNPTNSQLRMRIHAINGKAGSIGTENHFYCSQECKDSCSLYRMKASELMLYDKLKNETLSEIDFERMQIELRNYLLKIRNPDHCENCGEPFNQKDLILHHIIPVADAHILEADLDNLIFVCQDCHKLLHQKDGCKTGQLAQYSMENKLC